jgi:ATP-dependent helicase/nuclease subunit B
VIKEDARPAETLVTPTRRLAHHLQARHDRESLARGLVIWRTPDIVTWSGLIERMFMLDRQASRTSRRWLDDGAARLAWERLVQRDPKVTGVISPDGLARTAYRSWRLLHDYRIPLESAEAIDGPEVAVFMRWAEEFAAWLDLEGWMDAAGAQDWVDPASAGPRLRFVGFDELTPGQASFIERVREGGVEVVVEPPPAPGDGTVWVTAPDRDAELDMAARWAARRLDRAAGVNLAIVVPGLAQMRAQVRRVLDRVLAPAATVCGGPAPESHAYQLAAARPLPEQPLVAAALAWLSAFAHETDLAACGGLLRDAFCRAAAQEASSRAALDAWLRRHQASDLSLERLAGRAAHRGCPEMAALLQAGLSARAAWPRRALPSVWSQRFFELLQRVGWPGAELDSNEHQARQRWQSLLGEFGAHDDVAGPVSAGAALGLLRDLATATLFEPQEIRAPLLVIDPQTCAGMSFDGVWVCGLESGQWPAAMSPDPFLPRSWQVRRGVPGATAELTAAESRRTLDRLRGSAREVILSVPAFEDEAPLLPSALLTGIAAAPEPELWAPPQLARAVFAARPALVVTADGTMPMLVAGERAAGGAKLLELQAACPFRASAELRLGARALEEPSLGLDAAARGNLVHDVFARLWRDVRTSAAMQALPAGERAARVQAAIAAELVPLRRDANDVLLRLLEIEARWLERHAMLLLDQDLARPPFEVEHVEADRTVELGGLTLQLRIDRVDRLADGSCAVIDYKTGGNAKANAWLDERPSSPQLPLYVEAFGPNNVSAVAFGRVRAGETGFAGLARDPAEFPGCKATPKEFASWDALLAEWHRRLEVLAREFATGDARLAPDPRRACRYCHLPSLCRIGDARLAADDAGEGGDDE